LCKMFHVKHFDTPVTLTAGALEIVSRGTFSRDGRAKTGG